MSKVPEICFLVGVPLKGVIGLFRGIRRCMGFRLSAN